MSIIYIAIFHDNSKLILECTEYYGNLQTACKKLLNSLKKEFKGTFDYEDKYYFHYLNSNKITYICISNSTYQIDLAHMFLDQLKELLLNNFSEKQLNICDNVNIESMIKGKVIQKMEFFNQENIESFRKSNINDDLKISLTSDCSSINYDQYNENNNTPSVVMLAKNLKEVS